MSEGLSFCKVRKTPLDGAPEPRRRRGTAAASGRDGRQAAFRAQAGGEATRTPPRDTSFSSSSPTSYRRCLAILKLADRRTAFKIRAPLTCVVADSAVGQIRCGALRSSRVRFLGPRWRRSG